MLVIEMTHCGLTWATIRQSRHPGRQICACAQHVLDADFNNLMHADTFYALAAGSGRDEACGACRERWWWVLRSMMGQERGLREELGRLAAELDASLLAQTDASCHCSCNFLAEAGILGADGLRTGPPTPCR